MKTPKEIITNYLTRTTGMHHFAGEAAEEILDELRQGGYFVLQDVPVDRRGH